MSKRACCMRLIGKSIALLILTVTVSSCGSNGTFDFGKGGGNTPNEPVVKNGVDFKLSLPKDLKSKSVIESLQAYLEIKGTKFDLSVNQDTKEASGSMDLTAAGIEPGPTNIIISFVKYFGDSMVMLASATKTIDLQPGNNPINFSSLDFDRNYDLDKDGFTNLAEVRIGTTSPLESSEVPANDLYVKSEAYSSSYNITAPFLVSTMTTSKYSDTKTGYKVKTAN